MIYGYTGRSPVAMQPFQLLWKPSAARKPQSQQKSPEPLTRTRWCEQPRNQTTKPVMLLVTYHNPTTVMGIRGHPSLQPVPQPGPTTRLSPLATGLPAVSCKAVGARILCIHTYIYTHRKGCMCRVYHIGKAILSCTRPATCDQPLFKFGYSIFNRHFCNWRPVPLSKRC